MGQLFRFGKFSLVGFFGAALQLVLLWLLTSTCRMSPVPATALAVELVLLNNFMFHERFTWSDRRVPGIRQRLVRLVRFQTGNGLISLAGNTLLTYLFVERLKAPVLPSAIAAIALCAALNFLVADHWVY